MAQTTTEAALKPHGVTFADLDLTLCGAATFAAGDTIFREGDTPEFAYIIQTGVVEISKRKPDGQSITLAVLRPGIMFGELALIGNAPRIATARALHDTTCRTLHRTAFEAMLDGLDPLPRRVVDLLRYTVARATNTLMLSRQAD